MEEGRQPGSSADSPHIGGPGGCSGWGCGRDGGLPPPWLPAGSRRGGCPQWSQHSPDTSWEAVASCRPGRGVSGPSYPRFLHGTRTSCGHPAALFALPGVSLPPHLQISKDFPGLPCHPHVVFWDLYSILIYFFIGLSLSLLLFPARLSSRFALQRAAGWL